MYEQIDARITELYEPYLASLLEGNRQACQKIVSQLLASGIEIRQLYVGLFQHALYQVGELWEQNQISVAKEHLATATTESLLPLVYPVIFRTPRCGRRAVVSCVANEYHQLGGKMVADILELHGWDSYFLGANTPVDALLTMIEEKHPELLCLSLSVYFNLPSLLNAIHHVRDTFPDLRVLVGGQAFRWDGIAQVEGLNTVQIISSLDALEQAIRP
jgi:methanogenic corrinoid protein MtbC1